MYYPLFVEMENRRCLFVGGGNVALRKARTLCRFGARITVVAPEVDEGFRGLKAKICRREFCEEDLEGAELVVAATDNRELNAYIASLCRKRRIPDNAGREGSVFFGAVFAEEETVAAVSTNGKDPAKAARIRDGLWRALEEER